MKKWMIFFVVDLYLLPIFLCFTFIFMPKPITTDTQFPVLAYFLIAFFLLSFLLGFVNIVHAVAMRKNVNLRKKKINIPKIILVFKLCLVPFFMLNFILWSIFALGCYSLFMIFLWVFIPFGIAYTYILLLVTSAYSISQIIVWNQNGILTKKQCVKYIILQLLFVIDVIAYIILYRKYGKKTLNVTS